MDAANQKPKKFYLIQDIETGQYLKWKVSISLWLPANKNRGYHFEDDKKGAAILTSSKVKKIIPLLKKAGYYKLKKIRIRR